MKKYKKYGWLNEKRNNYNYIDINNNSIPKYQLSDTYIYKSIQ